MPQPLSRAVARGALLLLLLPPGAFAQTRLLNDTGQTQCVDAANVLQGCTNVNTGNGAAHPGQDARYGRDADPGLTKTGGGAAGFDFTRICWNGQPEGSAQCTGVLAENHTANPSGTPATDWACTRDNVTGLLWSLQTQIATWNTATVSTYPDAGHNSASRCGHATGWRLPTRRELLSIVHRGAIGPAVDGAYFPVTVSNFHWTSDEYKPNTTGAWRVYLNDGTTDAELKTAPQFIRLVRSLP